MKTQEDSSELKAAKEDLRFAVVKLLDAGGTYNDIEDQIQDGIVIAENTWKVVTIESKT